MDKTFTATLAVKHDSLHSGPRVRRWAALDGTQIGYLHQAMRDATAKFQQAALDAANSPAKTHHGVKGTLDVDYHILQGTEDGGGSTFRVPRLEQDEFEAAQAVLDGILSALPSDVKSKEDQSARHGQGRGR